MRCAIYVRVSTDEQAKAGYSLAAQVDRIKSFIKSQGWAACDIYSDDGYSAKDRKRPALKRLLDDASEKRFDAALVYKIDRLSRRLKDLIEIVEELAHYDVGFKSITELIDTTTPEGRLMFHQFGSFAQYERELIGQRTKLGMIKRLKEGKSDFGKINLMVCQAKIETSPRGSASRLPMRCSNSKQRNNYSRRARVLAYTILYAN